LQDENLVAIDEKTVIGDQATSDSSHGAKTASLAD